MLSVHETYLRNHSSTLHQIFWAMAVAQSSFGNIAIFYILCVFWTTSCFPIKHSYGGCDAIGCMLKSYLRCRSTDLITRCIVNWLITGQHQTGARVWCLQFPCRVRLYVWLKELQYENASLKAKLAELFAVQKCDREASDRKLGLAVCDCLSIISLIMNVFYMYFNRHITGSSSACVLNLSWKNRNLYG